MPTDPAESQPENCRPPILEGGEDDYDRACAVNALAGAVSIGEGGVQGPIIGDEPATTCYLPE
ncbi:Imm21 family immunity protein [Amycolatopsis sp. lyj-84]|uniref:Imm21 family immunity protein n=1 Tax=Amycolatopsis sp. lyj-84 TaxID=2789284 RepID=UPI00397ACE6B